MIKRYVLEFEHKNEILYCSGTCEGFTSLEILALLYCKIEDIQKQMRGEVKADVVKRTFIETDDGPPPA
jgi:hypothetical protein